MAARSVARRVLYCLLVLPCALSGCAPEPRGDDPRPDIVLVSVDSLRVDHLGWWGYPRPTSPEIAELAAAGVTFDRAIAQASWTLPSMATLLTGLYPSRHGAIKADVPLRDGVDTVATVLAGEGYQTLAVISHMFTSRRYGLHQGFDYFDESRVAGEDAISSQALTEGALEAVEQARPGPMLLWVHYFDPHFSYMRHPEYGFAAGAQTRFGTSVSYLDLGGLRGPPPGSFSEADRQYVVDLYDEEVRYTDHWIGELVRGLERARPERPRVVIFTADHGEYFGERGRFGHGIDVYGTLIDVPLVIAGDLPAELRGLRSRQPAELASIPATIMALAGVADHPFAGQDLLALAAQPPVARPIFAEGSYAWGEDARSVTVIEWPWKLIELDESRRVQLFDLSRDPAERTDRAGQAGSAPVVARLRAYVAAHRAGRPPVAAPVVAVDEQERAHLRALGYVDDEQPADAARSPSAP